MIYYGKEVWIKNSLMWRNVVYGKTIQSMSKHSLIKNTVINPVSIFCGTYSEESHIRFRILQTVKHMFKIILITIRIFKYFRLSIILNISFISKIKYVRGKSRRHKFSKQSHVQVAHFQLFCRTFQLTLSLDQRGSS